MSAEANPAPAFLMELLEARSPSGQEDEARAVFEKFVRPVAESWSIDALGSCLASLNKGGSPTLLLAGHMDELGFMVRHIDDKGFIYFDRVGGIDATTVSGRRVSILTKNGPVAGVTGRRAIHLLTDEERKKVPEWHALWIDIGVKSKAEALERVRIGDVGVYDTTFAPVHGSVWAGRAVDNKSGCYTVGETLRRLAGDKAALAAKVVSVATSQEEIGCRGARTAGYGVNADVALAVDVGHATDHPDCDHRRFGDFKLGAGPILTRGPNIHPQVFERLVSCAEAENIPYQIEADARPTGTDARELQMARAGVPTGLVSIPLRYMHTATEMVDLADIENVVRLLVAFARSLKPGDFRGEG